MGIYVLNRTGRSLKPHHEAHLGGGCLFGEGCFLSMGAYWRKYRISFASTFPGGGGTLFGNDGQRMGRIVEKCAKKKLK